MVALFEVTEVISAVAIEMLIVALSVENFVVFYIFTLYIVEERVREVALSINIFLTLLTAFDAWIKFKDFIWPQIHVHVFADIVFELFVASLHTPGGECGGLFLISDEDIMDLLESKIVVFALHALKFNDILME